LRASVGTANNNPVYVADQLAKDLNQQLVGMPSIDGGQFAFVDVLSNLTTAPLIIGTNASPTTITCGVTNNSAIVSFSTAINTGGTSAMTLAANDWVRIGSATATTSPVYQVASVAADRLSMTLTRPFVGTTAASGVAIGATSSYVNTGGTTIAATPPNSSSLSGLKVSVTGSYFTSNAYAAGRLNTMINIPLLDTLAGTPINVGTAMVYGSGTVSEVLKKEMQSLGNLGVENRIWMPLPNDTYAASNVGTGGTASVGNGYSIFTLYYENSVADKSAQGQGREESGMLDICINNFQTGTTAQDVDTLAALLANITGLPSGTRTGSYPSTAAFPNW
jgi:hypothetical protein